MERSLNIAYVFGIASVLSIGGANTIIPTLQKETVNVHDWLTDRQFVDCFAIAQVTPGPNSLIATLLGYRAGGIWGAIVATLAMTLPAVILAYVVTVFWNRTGHAKWHVALEHGIAPLGVGLVASAALIVARAVDHGVASWTLTLVALGLLVGTKINPIFIVLGGGMAGLIIGDM